MWDTYIPLKLVVTSFGFLTMTGRLCRTSSSMGVGCTTVYTAQANNNKEGCNDTLAHARAFRD